MRSHHEFLTLRWVVAVGATVPGGEDGQRVGVEDEATVGAGQKPRDDKLRRDACTQPHSHHGHIGLRRNACRSQFKERRLRHQCAGGNARGFWNDELHQPRACRARTEAGDDRRMDVVRRSANHGDRTDSALVGICRTPPKRLRKFARRIHVGR